VAKENKSLTARFAEDAEENKSSTAEAAKAAEVTLIRTELQERKGSAK